MIRITNGTPACAITGARWTKASASDGIGDCVELARVNETEVAVRNSRFPDGPALVFTRAEIIAFLDGASHGEFTSMTV
ncbi:DUF397 domain-containing protein [Streptomyces sp. NEAU-YJ-81]|uniref:DUF397 domain-containing protein n=1 Tax=unclassified Streptomyces TaxID=2593676 RepID=UPI001ABCA3A7|nr:DUF397 domain-containing protein [Streptomyces sp. NEAU-YJ-81]MBO3676883.1 DUF397 domain-containing protein [Streptomyces sp. NEAU-YJ-81]WTB08946.1 DUF397 domain-containing protein [Streptomyces antimycoticus]